MTLPADVVAEFGLKQGDEVDVSVHPQTGAIIVRTAVNYIERGRVTKAFRSTSKKVLSRYDKAFRELAK